MPRTATLLVAASRIPRPQELGDAIADAEDAAGGAPALDLHRTLWM